MSAEPQHPINPADGQVGLVVHWEKATKTKTIVKARFNGTLIHSHAFDLNSASGRASYAQAVAEKIQAARDQKLETAREARKVRRLKPMQGKMILPGETEAGSAGTQPC